MALVVLSVVEQRLDAVRAVLAGAEVTEIASQLGVHRSTVHRWIARYLSGQLAGLADRSHRPVSCPHQVDETVEVVVTEMRREHPRWGSRRIRLELLRHGGPWQRGDLAVPSERTIDRILIRQGLVRARPLKRPRDSFLRFERPGPMQLWGIDIVGGIELVDPLSGMVREAKIVTGVDDHSRFCVLAAVVERATSRAVCVAFGEALARYGVPEEVITDNGKQFTGRFGRGPQRGEVLFDTICRRNGITHRLTQPASPNQNGKVERFHGTFRPEISEQGPFSSLLAAQAAVDTWVAEYNTERPHQALDERQPVVPADRFQPAVPATADVELWVPPSLVPKPAPEPESLVEPSVLERQPGDAIELDRVVPPSGNLWVGGRQFWLGPARSGQIVRFWLDCEWVHLSVGGQRVKSLRSRFATSDLDTLVSQGAIPAGPEPVASRGGPGSREVRRIVEVGTHRRQGRHRLSRGPPRAGCRDSGWTPNRDLHRRRRPTAVFRPRHPRTPAHPPQPAHPRRRDPPATVPPARPGSASLHRTGHRATPRQRRRHDHRLRPDHRPRPRPQTPHRDRPRRRHHDRDRPARRRNHHRPPHHRSTGP